MGYILKIQLFIWNQRSGICLIANFDAKMEILKFGTKKAFLWAFFGLEFQRGIQERKFHAAIKMLKSRKKNALFWYFWAGIWKNYCHIWNHHCRICVIVNFDPKWKSLNLGSKMLLFGSLGGIFPKQFPYLKLAPSNSSY